MKLILRHLKKNIVFSKTFSIQHLLLQNSSQALREVQHSGITLFSHAQVEALCDFWGLTCPLEISYFVEINSVSNHIYVAWPSDRKSEMGIKGLFFPQCHITRLGTLWCTHRCAPLPTSELFNLDISPSLDQVT